MKRTFLLLLIIACQLAGCAVNPVTGERELSLVSQQQEIAIGGEQYGPALQMQGGEYIVDPRLDSYVSRIGDSLAAVSDRPLPYEFTVLNNSVPNAWALPGGKIAINRGLLLELDNEAELAAVLGHEIVHSAARHGAKSMERGMLLQGALLATSMAAGSSQYSQLAVGGAQIAAGLISQKYSRDAEREADFYGMQYMSRAGYDVSSAVSLQQTFVRLAEGRRQDWLSGLFASHPPSQERVAANRDTMQTLPPGGEVARERYQDRIGHLKQTAPAYAAYDQGRAALAKGDPDRALELAEQAMAIEPREALFHGLKGDVFSERRDYDRALANYNRAIDLNDRFFQFYVQRGLIRNELGDRSGAEEDLSRSAQLLPTAPALKKLGDFALDSGERDLAKQYFEAAADSSSTAGKEAQAAFLRLDVGDNPQKYLRLTPMVANTMVAGLKLANPTPLNLGGISLQLRYVDASGQVRQGTLNLAGVLPAGEKAELSLEEFSIPEKNLATLQATVLTARVMP